MALELRQLGKTAIEFFFPSHCVGCGRVGSYICSRCIRSQPRIFPPVCSHCGKPEPSGSFCPTCWGIDSPIDGIRSPFKFEGAIRQSIYELKYNNLRAIASSLGNLLFDYIRRNPIIGEILIPVPLHPKRLRHRGYNQSSLLALELGKLASIPVNTACLSRTRYFSAQAKAPNVEERKRNVEGAFSCSDNSVSGQNIILIDDVCTSGATLDSCSQALKSAGAASVWGLTLAREI